MKHLRLRGLAGATLALVLSAGLAPTATAAEVGIGPFVVQVPDLAPVHVPVPPGSEAAPLPPLPYPFQWVRPAPPFDPFGGRTLALDCGGNPERMPSRIIIICGDGTGQFQNIRWTSWLDGTAEGTAEKVWVECVPACYNGIRRSKPARIVLHDVRYTPAGPAYAKLTSHDDRGARTTAMSSFPFEPGDQIIFP
ncbi:hypothetical protein G6031_17820 [Dietzia sp. CQ4]|uniref:hypothetical protein n=1 Tax=Dietzia sp. (strain CQ4) TaxID=370437 RepID=UPI0015F9E4E5|nr:hypothetical protein [Dietzia sp. CQ4]MBB1036229.1 hypothetical protein [Dietzia sp. CQ4]